MKRFEQWLLLNHPLIWNTRIYILLPIIIVLNVLFFGWGYLSLMDLKNLGYYYRGAEFGQGLIAVFTGTLLVIGWLSFYLRQNPFKSFLPLKKWHLLKEFIIILMIFLGIGLGIFSYQWGKITKIKNLSQETNLVEEVNIINLSAHFLPFDVETFNPRYDLSAPPDSSKFDQITYLNFHEFPLSLLYSKDKDSIKSHEENTKDANTLILNYNRQGIRNVLNQYEQLCKKYNISYSLNIEKRIQSIFSTPDFKLNGETLGHYDYDKKTEYVDDYRLQTAILRIDEAKSGPLMEQNTFILYIYWCLGLTIVLFSFRITRIKIWFLAIISFGLFALSSGLLAVIMGESAKYVIVLLPVILFILAFIGIRKRLFKTISGVTFNLSLWSLTGFVSVFYELTKERRYYKEDYSSVSWHPYIDYANFIFALIMIIFVMIPLAKKWQANPEE